MFFQRLFDNQHFQKKKLKLLQKKLEKKSFFIFFVQYIFEYIFVNHA